MCASMVDIQSATAEIRPRKKIETTAKIWCPHLLCRAAINILFSNSQYVEQFTKWCGGRWHCKRL